MKANQVAQASLAHNAREAFHFLIYFIIFHIIHLYSLCEF